MHYLSLFFFLLQILFPLFSQEEKSKPEITEQMQLLFSQHITEKKMTKEILVRSLSFYLSHFDPQGDYLTREEWEKWKAPSAEIQTRLIEEYHQNQFTLYKQLDQLIEKSILRARSIRKSLREEPIQHMNVSSIPSFSSQPEDEGELREKQKWEWRFFFHKQWRRSAQKASEREKREIFAFFEKKKRREEERFLSLSKNSERKYFHLLASISSALDIHTQIFSPQEAQKMRSSLEKKFSGIGVLLEEKFDGIEIVKLLSGGGAQESQRIHPGDRIIQIEGKSVKGRSLEEIASQLHGEEGSSIFLTLLRSNKYTKGKKFSLHVKRKAIALKEQRVSLSSQPFHGGILGKIRLHSFYEGGAVSSEKDVLEALRTLQKEGELKGLILDLRDNPGGFLEQAIRVAGLFLHSGVISMAKYGDGSIQLFRDLDGRSHFDGPLIILISKSSASAAEIVAQSLQDYGRALVVGSNRSFGKGTIQRHNLIQEGKVPFFKVTVGRFYTPSGKSTQWDGVKADLLIPGPWFHQEIGERFLPLALKQDRIAPRFYDSLEDIPPKYHRWFRKNYLPHIDMPQSFWAEQREELQKRSHRRLLKNPLFGSFLSSSKRTFADSTTLQQVISAQEEEAFYVLKDMIHLQEEKQ